MIELRHISLGFGSRSLITDASTRFECGKITALLGRNGTGKSTLLRTIAALQRPVEGEVFVGGDSLVSIGSQQLAKRLSFVNTERVDVEALRVFDVVAMGRSPYTDWMGRLTKDDEDVVRRSIALAGIEHLAERYVDTLSDGECQRVMIARALAQDTPAILLDEPTSFLDLPNRYELCRLLAELAHNENKCIIFSTHELDIALSLADSIALVDTPQLVHLDTQAMIESGSIERLFNSDFVGFDPATRSICLRK
jgi:iron complex transport system ATP-binding protein